MASGRTEGGGHAVAQVAAALEKTSYRSELSAAERSRTILRRAIDMVAVGGTAEQVQELDALDRQKAEKRGALLAVWVDRRIWRDVLAEQRMKRRPRVVQRSESAPTAIGSVLGPIVAASRGRQAAEAQA